MGLYCDRCGRMLTEGSAYCDRCGVKIAWPQVSEATITNRPAIIVDIDNVVLNNDERKRRILKDIFGEDVSLVKIHEDYNLRGVVGERESFKFFDEFFSGKFLKYDQPVPFSAEVLNRLKEKFKIVYLTGRHTQNHREEGSMEYGTLDALRKYGFPLPGNNEVEIVFKHERDLQDEVFKAAELQRIKERGLRIVAGIGDTPDDAAVYSRCGIQPVCLITPYFEKEDFETSCKGSDTPELVKPIIAYDWREIEMAICMLSGSNENFRKTAEFYVKEYDEYLRTMDELARSSIMIAGAAIAVMGIVFGQPGVALALRTTEMSTQLFLALSGGSFLFSLVFNIGSTLIRSSHPPKVGKPVLLTGREYFLRKKMPLPREVMDKLDRANSYVKRSAFLSFLSETYGTIDTDAVLANRFFNLRSMCYRKGWWVSIGQILLLVGFLLLIPLLVSIWYFSFICPTASPTNA